MDYGPRRSMTPTRPACKVSLGPPPRATLPQTAMDDVFATGFLRTAPAMDLFLVPYQQPWHGLRDMERGHRFSPIRRADGLREAFGENEDLDGVE